MNRTARTTTITTALAGLTLGGLGILSALPAQAGVGGFFRDATQPAAPPYTVVYSYGPADPTKPLGADNSGPQTRVDLLPGYVDHRTLPYPTDCGVSYQVDWVNAEPADIPTTLPGSHGLGAIFVKGWHHVGQPCEVVVPPVEQPPVEAPPVTETPTPSPATPVTPEAPKDLSALSVDERAGVEQFAQAHGIAPEAVLVEMG